MTKSGTRIPAEDAPPLVGRWVPGYNTGAACTALLVKLTLEKLEDREGQNRTDQDRKPEEAGGQHQPRRQQADGAASLLACVVRLRQSGE
jgi:hypothetical protein